MSIYISKKNILKKFLSFLLIMILFIQTSLYSYAAPNGYSYLLMPTQILKINNTYYIVDCNHNQIIYSDNLGLELRFWNVMTRNVTGPHSLASDGEIYMVTDTENNRLLTFEKTYDGFKQLQIFENIGIRPHYVSYDHIEGLFYAWSSMTGEMYIYKRVAGTRTLALQEIKSVPELNNCYVRSFTLSGDVILFPAIERGCITVVDKETFEIMEEYPVPEQIAGMVQITIIGDYFYLTVSTDQAYNPESATIIRAKNLSDFSSGTYEDLYHLFGNNGTPYYISSFDGSYYMIHENAAPNIYRFHVKDNKISDIKGMF